MNHIWKDISLATPMKRRARVFTLRRKLSNSLRKKYEWWNIYITPLRGGRYAGRNVGRAAQGESDQAYHHSARQGPRIRESPHPVARETRFLAVESS